MINSSTVSYSSHSECLAAVSLLSSRSAPLFFCCFRNDFIPARAEQTVSVTTKWFISSKLKPKQRRREITQLLEIWAKERACEHQMLTFNDTFTVSLTYNYVDLKQQQLQLGV